MQCETCKAEIQNLGAKFCPNCGNKLFRDDRGRKAEEVTREWLRDILHHLDYEVTLSESDTNNMLAVHKTKPNFLIDIKRDFRIIAIQSLWKLKKPSWGKKGELIAAINKANNISWIGIYSVNDTNEGLTVSSHINLTDSLSEGDIVFFIDKFATSLDFAFTQSGLREFS